MSETVIDPDSSFVGVISITDADGDPVDPETIRIEGTDAGSFEIRINPETNTPELHFIGDPGLFRTAAVGT